MPAQEQKMERTSVSLPLKQLEKIDKIVEGGDYPNRSDVIRAAVREFTDKRCAIVEVSA